jgi:uncharacterized protein (DUF58 family)
MTLLPSARFLAVGAVLGAASLGLLVVPEALLVLLAADLVLIGAAVVDWLLTPGPNCLSVARTVPAKMTVPGTGSVELCVRNGSRMPLTVRVRDSAAPALQAEPEEVAGTVPADGETVLVYEIRPATRGRFAFGDLHLRYRSLLGLWERGLRVTYPAEVQAYPGLTAAERQQLRARPDRALGERMIRVKGVSWEFDSLRDFVNGDDTRLLDWKATARRQKLIVRQQRAERNQSVIVLVDAGRLMTAEEAGTSKLDHAIHAALLLAHVGLARGDRVGLCAFSQQIRAWVMPRRRLTQMRLITEALYDLQADFTESDHGRCLRQLAVRHPKRALLIVLTDFVDAETAADMVAAAAHAARRHVVLFAALNDPFLEAAARARPRSETEAFRKAMALALLRERREVLERLHQLGVQVVDATPGAISASVLNKYLEISQRGLL